MPGHGHRAGAVAGATTALLACLAPLLAAAPATAGDALTIYRCTASDGTVSLGNQPCGSGERQQQRTMERPRDPAPGANPVPPAPAQPAPPPRSIVHVVRVQDPEPMYACTAPDGERYLSDQPQGTPRWVPIWVAGRAPPPRLHPPRPPARPGPGRDPVPPVRPPHPGTALVATGTWVQDPCERLPQEEVCARLSDRRYGILRVYHGLMPSERQALDAEQARIDARMARDCGGG